jgi:hypothetical protein
MADLLVSVPAATVSVSLSGTTLQVANPPTALTRTMTITLSRPALAATTVP